jgi:hypothetical protein
MSLTIANDGTRLFMKRPVRRGMSLPNRHVVLSRKGVSFCEQAGGPFTTYIYVIIVHSQSMELTIIQFFIFNCNTDFLHISTEWEQTYEVGLVFWAELKERLIHGLSSGVEAQFRLSPFQCSNSPDHKFEKGSFGLEPIHG